jgi:hypothetical protein
LTLIEPGLPTILMESEPDRRLYEQFVSLAQAVCKGRLSLIALTAALQSHFQEYPREARTKDGKPHDGQPKE